MAVEPRQGFPAGRNRSAARLTRPPVGLSALPDPPEDIWAKMKMMVRSEAELAAAILAADAPIGVHGGGTRARVAGHGLATSGLSGVKLYEPGALTLVVGAGTPLAEVEALLAGERQRLGFEPPVMNRLMGRDGASTIGGVAAMNASGPRRVQVGAARDAMLGVRMVTGRGEIVSNGGRVMKNVTGYDLVKLVAGSRGTLGVLTEISLRVQAVPEAEVTLVSERDLAEGLATLRAGLRTPFDLSGAAWAGGRAMIRVEGLAGSVAYRARSLREGLGGDWAVVEGAQSAALWAAQRDVLAFAGRAGAVWRLHCRQTDARQIADALGIGADRVVADWGGALLWVLAEPAFDLRGALRDARLAADATVVRGAEGLLAATLPPEAPEVAALTQGLRQAFDPLRLFSQGAM
jgi:glycolate oxidase FAD binding subunit